MEFLLNLNTWFKSLPSTGKVLLFLVVVTTLSAGFFIYSQYKYTGYQYLYTNLSLNDINSMAERLQAMNIPMQIQGDAILVPGGRVLELRNSLASEGLPRGGGIGFEIFDQKKFGETEFQQRINFIRALQGELSRTISVIDGVEKARVHLVIPEKALFREDQKPPAVSIALSMYKGRSLSESQIRGIVHLVLTSVENLSEANMNVIDQHGNILFKGPRDDGSGFSSKNLEAQVLMEEKLEHGILDMLEKIVGPGGATIKVSAALDFSRVEKVIESVDPENRAALSEQVSSNSSTGNRGTVGGVPGATTNVPGAAATSTSPAQSDTSKQTETSATYAISKSTSKIIQPTGTIQRLSVAVLVDGKYNETNQYSPRSSEELKKIEDLVKRAIGYNAERGDEIKVENMQFKQRLMVIDENAVIPSPSPYWISFLLDRSKVLGIILLVSIIFILLIRLMKSYTPPFNVAYANLIGQEAKDVAKALPPKATINIVNRDDPAVKEREAQIASQIQEAKSSPIQEAESNLTGQGEIKFVGGHKSITVEAAQASEQKLRFQAAKLQAEAIMKENVDDAVRIIRTWLHEG